MKNTIKTMLNMVSPTSRMNMVCADHRLFVQWFVVFWEHETIQKVH